MRQLDRFMLSPVLGSEVEVTFPTLQVTECSDWLAGLVVNVLPIGSSQQQQYGSGPREAQSSPGPEIELPA